MKPDEKEIALLVAALRSKHGLGFDVLLKESKKLVAYLKGLDNFKFIQSDPSLDIPHVGRVILDAVLQVGHHYEKQVRKRVEQIAKYPEAATVSGFVSLLKQKGISQLLDWNSPKMQEDLISVANFFAEQGIETYSELKEWLKAEDNRDSLLSERSGLGHYSIFRVSDKTADYFRVLVGHWDAVAVDSNIRAILENAGIASRYTDGEKRTIFQLAALEMNLTPIDLDTSIYSDSVVHPDRFKKSKKGRKSVADERERERKKEQHVSSFSVNALQGEQEVWGLVKSSFHHLEPLYRVLRSKIQERMPHLQAERESGGEGWLKFRTASPQARRHYCHFHLALKKRQVRIEISFDDNRFAPAKGEVEAKGLESAMHRKSAKSFYITNENQIDDNVIRWLEAAL